MKPMNRLQDIIIIFKLRSNHLFQSNNQLKYQYIYLTCRRGNPVATMIIYIQLNQAKILFHFYINKKPPNLIDGSCYYSCISSAESFL